MHGLAYRTANAILILVLLVFRVYQPLENIRLRNSSAQDKKQYSVGIHQRHRSRIAPSTSNCSVTARDCFFQGDAPVGYHLPSRFGDSSKIITLKFLIK